MIRTSVDAARRRVVVTLAGEVTGPGYVAWTLDLLAAQPALGGYDFVYDLHAYQGRVSHDDIAAMAPRYAALVGDADRGAVTVLVTADEGFRFWADLFVVQFPNRTWRVVPTLAGAEAVLAEAARRGGGGAAGGGAPPP
jgi:hypothetical protein